MEYTDEELVRLAQKNDVKAMTTLLERYKYIVKIKVRGLFLVGGDEDDLLQEGMIGLHRAILDYSEGKGATFKSFASLCVHRQVIDAIKQSRRKKNMPLYNYASLDVQIKNEDEEGSYACNFEALNSNPEQILMEREAYTSLMTAIKEKLTETDSKILDEYLLGKSYVEIAEATQKSVKQVDNALQKIKKKILALKINSED